MRSPVGTLVARVGALTNKAPVPYVGRSGGGWASGVLAPNNAASQMAAMGSVGTLFSIVDRLATSSAAPEWKLWRKAAPGQQAKDREEVTSHLALDIWRKPNDFYTGSLFRETYQQHYDLVGEGWWVIARDPRYRSIPLELWPVRPDRMLPVPSRENFLAGYLYVAPDGEQVPLQLDEVIQIRRPNPIDPYRGIGPVQTILADLEGVRLSAEWNRNFFRNSAEPGGIIKVDRRLSEPEFDELRLRWGEQHRGVANAHRVAILEQGEWVDRKYTQKDMQFVELRSVASSVIREAYGMPKFAVGDVEDINRATADASKAWFSEQMTVPRCRRTREALNHFFLPLFGPTGADLEFDFEDPVPANREVDNAELTARSGAAKTLVDAGYEPAAVLTAVGLPEIEHVGAPAPATTGEQPPSRRGAAPAARLHLRNESDSRPRQDWEDRLDTLIGDWAADVTPGQINELLAQIEKVVDTGTPADLAALTVSFDAGAGLLAEAMFAQADAAGKRIARMAGDQGVSISPVTPIEPVDDMRIANAKAAKFVDGLAADLVAGAKVAAAFLAGGLSASAAREALRVWSPGATVKDIVKQVRAHLEGLTDAMLRSELGGSIWAAENEGRSATLEQAEADGKGPGHLVADEANDLATCGPCKAIDGTRFETLDEAQAGYPFGGYRDCEGRSRCRGTYWPSWE